LYYHLEEEPSDEAQDDGNSRLVEEGAVVLDDEVGGKDVE